MSCVNELAQEMCDCQGHRALIWWALIRRYIFFVIKTSNIQHNVGKSENMYACLFTKYRLLNISVFSRVKADYRWTITLLQRVKAFSPPKSDGQRWMVDWNEIARTKVFCVKGANSRHKMAWITDFIVSKTR